MTLLYAWICLALVLMHVQFFLVPGYGRHASSKWGPGIPNKAGWVIMELVALLAFWWAYLVNDRQLDTVILLAVGLWSIHYLNRSLIYPLRTRTAGKQMPLVIVRSG